MPIVVHLSAEHDASRQTNDQGLLDELPEPFAYFDSENRLEVCNRSFRSAFPRIIEEHFVRRLKDHSLEAMDGWLWREGQRPDPNFPIRSRSELVEAVGTEFPGDIPNMVPRIQKTSDGGTLVTFQDVSSQLEMERHYRNQLARLQSELAECLAQQQDAAISPARIDVLAATTHELRTPLNAILGFSEIMKEELFGPLGHERYVEYARLINESGGRLLALTNDLLDMSKLNAGKLRLNVEDVEIFRVIIDCVRQVETQAARSQIGISVQVFDGVKGVPGDDKRLHQMLLNLLSNAVKFTPERGEVAVEVFRRSEFIGISVTDTGIGMRPEDIPAMLEPFTQADDPIGRKQNGTGLGLPLTKELTELHGGTLTIESAVDAGTTVTLLLPEAKPAADPETPAEDVAPS